MFSYRELVTGISFVPNHKKFYHRRYLWKSKGITSLVMVNAFKTTTCEDNTRKILVLSGYHNDDAQNFSQDHFCNLRMRRLDYFIYKNLLIVQQHIKNEISMYCPFFIYETERYDFFLSMSKSIPEYWFTKYLKKQLIECS